MEFPSTRSLPLATDLNPIYPEIHRFRLIYTRVFHARPSLFRTIFLILYEMNFSTKHDLAFLSNYRWMYSGNFSIFSGSFIFSSGIKNSETSISFLFKNHYFIVARRIVVQNCFILGYIFLLRSTYLPRISRIFPVFLEIEAWN